MNTSRILLSAFLFVLLVYMSFLPTAFSQPVLLDDFDDNMMNPSLWFVHQGGSGPSVAEINQRVEIDFPATASGSPLVAGFFSVSQLRGDFDIQTDFSLLNWPSGNGVRVGLTTSANRRYDVVPGAVERISEGRGLSGNPLPAPLELYLTHFGDGVQGHTETGDVSGALRLVRVGTQLTGYYRTPEGWVAIHSGPSMSDDVYFRLTAWSGDNVFNDQAVKLAFDNFMVNQGELVNPQPAPEPDGEPCAVDDFTVALYHFDGNFQDAGPHGLHLTAAGGVQTAGDNTGWMNTPAGQVLRTTNLGDQVTVNIPDELFLQGPEYNATTGAAPLTFEARFYPRDYKAYSQNDALVISLRQSWDTMVEVKDGKWNNPPVPHVQGGAAVVVTPGMWESAVAPDTWHHLRMTLDPMGGTQAYAEVSIDGTPVGGAVVGTNYGRSGTWLLTLGNFDGDIDEVRISKAIRPGFGEGSSTPPDTTAPTAPADLTAIPVSNSRIDLTWTAATDPESGVTSYRIYRDGIPAGTTGGTSYADSGLTAGTTYTYAVSALNGEGLEGPQSTPVNAATPAGGGGGEGGDLYPVDARVIALYHFDGDFGDAGPNGLHFTVSGNAQLASDNLGWMTEPSGQALRVTNPGDKVTVSIPDVLVLPGSGAEVTIDARIYPRNYKAYGQNDYPVISLNQSWDTMLEVRDGKWNNPPVPRALGGNVTVVSPAVWDTVVALNTWHHFRMTLDESGRVEVYIDSVLIDAQTVSMNYARTGNWLFTLGNFDGDIDEVRISDIVRTGAPGESDPTPPNAPANLTAMPMSSSSIALQWSVVSDPESGIAAYQIFRDDALAGTTSDTSYTDTGIDPGTTYSYAVSTVNGAGMESPRSDPVSAATPVLVDDFDDNTINADLWVIQQGGNGPAVTETNGRLEINIPADASAVGPDGFHGGYSSAFRLTGDFDLQVEYHMLTWPARNGVRIGVTTDANPSAVVRISEGYNVSSPPYELYLTHFGDGVQGKTATDHLAGILKLVRSGNQQTGYYWNQSSWVEIHTGPISSADVSINIKAWSGDDVFSDQQVTVAFDNFIVNQGQLVDPDPAPGAEPPYTLDEYTVALFHFDEDFQDAGPHGLHLSTGGNAQLANDNLGWMTAPAGQTLRTSALGDQVSVTIPDALLLPMSGLSPLTVDAMIYPRTYRAYSVMDARVVSLFQSWDTMFEVRDGKWNNPPVPHVMAGSQMMVAPAAWASNVAFNAWHHLRMTMDESGMARVLINGAEIGAQAVSMNASRTGTWTFTLGNFDGDIDEVRISNIIRTDGASLARPVAAQLVSQPADDTAVPLNFALAQNYPNPFNPSTTITYLLPQSVPVRLIVYNLLGQEVRRLVQGTQTAGAHHVVWDGRNETGNSVSSGIYIYRIEAGMQTAARKMVYTQ